jgi:drug/metabolite transporter (DMT)-like permease
MARTALGAVFGPFLGVSLSLLAVQRTQAGVASAIMSIVPVLIILPSVLLFRERVTARAVMGAALAVGGVAVLFLA